MARPLSLLRTEPDGRIYMTPLPEDAATEKVMRPLKIINASEGSVAWKVRTNAPDAFLVQPRSGVLKTGESAEAEISLLGSALENCTVPHPRFEVRAFAVDADCERVDREDWTLWRASLQEASYLSAVVRVGGATSNSSGAPRQHLAGNGVGVDDSNDVSTGSGTGGNASGRASGSGDRGDRQDAFGNPDFDCNGDGADTMGGFRMSAPSRRSWDGDTSSGRRFGDGDAASGGYGDRGDMRQRHSRWEPDRDRQEDATRAMNEGGSTTNPCKSGDPAPMSATTKSILGLLIAILLFNLYLKPLVSTLMGDVSSTPPG